MSTNLLLSQSAPDPTTARCGSASLASQFQKPFEGLGRENRHTFLRTPECSRMAGKEKADCLASRGRERVNNRSDNIVRTRHWTAAGKIRWAALMGEEHADAMKGGGYRGGIDRGLREIDGHPQTHRRLRAPFGQRLAEKSRVDVH